MLTEYRSYAFRQTASTPNAKRQVDSHTSHVGARPTVAELMNAAALALAVVIGNR
jgi:hypothetical protein